MAVSAQNDIGRAVCQGENIGEHAAVLLGRCVTRRVGKVDGGRTCGNGGFDDFDQEIDFSAGCVLG